MIIKRIAAPRLWKFKRKTKMRYAIAPKPGPHPKDACLPLGHIIRDVLGIAETRSEVRSILNRNLVKVDGVIRKDAGFPLGLMDVLTIDDKHWRIVPGKSGFDVKPIAAAESSLKPLKVVNKRHVNGKTQINLHDGRNMLVDRDVYRTSDVILYDLVGKSVKAVVQFKRGALVLIVKGKNRGKVGRVEDIISVRGLQPSRVIVKSDKETLETLKDFVFAIGQDKPMVEL
jgi:small subunit ribosomal protein S4e